MSILLDGGKKTGRSTLKGIAAVAKRGMHQKLKIEFSAKRGGPRMDLDIRILRTNLIF